MRPDIGFINKYDSSEQLASSAAAKIAELLNKTISEKNQVNIALSGGTTPSLYFKILVDEYADKISWEKVNVYWADERYVPHTSPESNYGNALNAFLSKLPLINIYPVNTLLPCEQCAYKYEKLLHDNLPHNNLGTPVFDIVLLGMGDDGHIASLFPGSQILNESKKSVACVYVDKVKMNRISLTFPVLNNALNRIIVFTGANKVRIFNEACDELTSDKYPVQGLFKSKSETYWMFV